MADGKLPIRSARPRVTDFDATFARLAARGFVEIWRDTWLWVHQEFRKKT